MKILIVDDQLPNRLIAKFLVESEGHTCIQAENGQDALETFMKERPDFVLMDIVMPIMDGYQATYYIKNYAGETHVPIIFLTAKHDEASLLKCLESGGDDYLVKPINGTLLKAKIRAHERTLELTQQVQAKNKELTEVYSSLSREHEMGRHVLNHALQRNLKDCPNIKSYISSMSYFNGDLFLLAESPNGGLFVFLGDFTGHGLSAAMGTIPISELFFSMCNQGEGISNIISAMNTSLKNFLPENMFCAATLVHMHEKGESAHIWSGGLPEGYVVRSNRGVHQVIQSQNLPLGILSEDKFKDEPKYFRFKEGDRLILLSDGILESTNPETGEMYGESRLKEVLRLGEDDLLAKIIESYQVHKCSEKQKDDVSLVEILAAPYETKFIRDSYSGVERPAHLLPLSIFLPLEAVQIKTNNVVAEVINLLPAFIRMAPSFDNFKTVLSELYSNALEHGLLNLSSEIKNASDGFTRYYQLREENLLALEEGFISIGIKAYEKGNVLKIKLSIEDSGNGFAYKQRLQSGSPDSQLWGRGLSLVSSLSEELTYSETGTKVEAIVSLI